MVTADELNRSFRGATAFLTRRPEGLGEFEFSLAALGRSFAAIALTAPAYVVEVALARHAAGLSRTDLFDATGLALVMLVGHVLAFLAPSLAMAALAPRLRLAHRYVPFAVVQNWVLAFGSYALAAPAALLVLGLETPALATLFAIAFAAIVLHVQWFAARVTLEVGDGLAAAVAALGFSLSAGSVALAQALAVQA